MKRPAFPPWLWGLVLIVPPAWSTPADADLWWHLAAGREILEQQAVPRVDTWSYTAAGAPWIDHEWVFEVVIATVHAVGGTAGLLGFRAVVLALGMACWLAVVARRTPAPVAFLLVAPPWPLLSLLCNLRPQTLTWMLVPAALALADALHAGRRWAAPGLAVLVLAWVNLHGGFLFGWGLAGLALLFALRRPEGRASVLVALLVVVLAPLANAYGLELVAYTLRELTTAHPDLPEWNPPSPGMAVVAAVFALPPLVGFAFVRPRVDPVPWVGLLVACVATAAAAKFVALILILSPVCLADLATAFGPRLRARPDFGALQPFTAGPGRWGALLVGLALALPFARGTPGTVPVPTGLYPAEATAWLAGATGEGRMLVPLGWGGMVVARLGGRWTVSLDGRNTTVFPASLVQAHTAAWATGDLPVLLATGPDAALVPAGSPIDRAFEAVPGWRAVWRDPTAAVWVGPHASVVPGEPRPCPACFP